MCVCVCVAFVVGAIAVVLSAGEDDQGILEPSNGESAVKGLGSWVMSGTNT